MSDISTESWLAGKLTKLGITRDAYTAKTVGRIVEALDGRRGKVVDVADDGLVVEFADGKRETLNPKSFMASSAKPPAADPRQQLVGRSVVHRSKHGRIIGLTPTGYRVQLATGAEIQASSFDHIGPKGGTGDVAEDARAALAELDAIRRGDGVDYSEAARAAIVHAQARGAAPVTRADVERALAGGRTALAKRDAERTPAAPSFAAGVFAEVERLLKPRRSPA